MLMLIYRITADSAFELLKWRSQECNVKLRVLAEQIVKDFLDLHLRRGAAAPGPNTTGCCSPHTYASG